jgi:hypothetical protein
MYCSHLNIQNYSILFIIIIHLSIIFFICIVILLLFNTIYTSFIKRLYRRISGGGGRRSQTGFQLPAVPLGPNEKPPRAVGRQAA